MRFILILLLIPCIITAQVNPVFVVKSNLNYPFLQFAGEGLFGFEKDGKYGYMDINEKVIIQPEYSYENTTYKSIPYFSNGYAIVRKSGKVGLIDKSGKEVVPFEYDNISTISSLSGYFIVRRSVNGKNQYGVMNSMQSKLAIPVEYDDMQTDSNLIGVKQNGKWGLFDVTGKQIFPIEYTSLTVYAKDKICRAEKDGKYGFIDLKGNWIFDKAKSVYSLYGLSQGMIMCAVSSKYGYLDMKGNEVIITKYDNASSFESIGLARVSNKTGSNSLFGYIDKKGTEIIPLKYQTIGYSFSNGLIYAKDPETNRYGYFDKTGKWALQPVYLDATSFDEHGGAWVKMTDGKYHYINKTGKDLGTIDDKGASTRLFGKNGFAVYENTDNSYVLLDNTGKIVMRLEDCDAVYNFSEGIGGFKCKSNSKYGFIDLNGKKITNCDFDGFAAFTEEASKVDKVTAGKTKSGYVDTKGNIILPLVYDNVYAFRNGWGLIKKDGNYFFVDKNGNLKEPPAKYDELTEFRSGYALGKIKGETNSPSRYVYINTDLKEEFTVSAMQAFPIWETVAVVSSDNKNYELMNKKGSIFKILNGIEQIIFCTEGMLGIKEKGKWGYINDKGDVIISPKYDTCTGFKYGFGRVRSNGKWGIVDRSGTEIFTTKYDNILPGENGYFIFYNGTGWGVMDKTGKVIIQPVMYTITPFEKNRAMARTGKTYTIVKSPLAK